MIIETPRTDEMKKMLVQYTKDMNGELMTVLPTAVVLDMLDAVIKEYAISIIKQIPDRNIADEILESLHDKLK